MFSINKNSYLHNYYKDINPCLINRCVQQAWDYLIIDEHDYDKPFNRLTSEQPCIPVQNVDVTRRPLGFGRIAMTKLRKELHNDDPVVVVAAIESICDLVHDSERAFEAINVKVIQRLESLIRHPDPVIRERTNRTFAIFARLAAGREVITSNTSILTKIIASIEDEYVEVRMQTAALLEMLARFWKAADILISHNCIHILLEHLLVENKEIVVFYLKTLQSLMYEMYGKMQVLEGGGFEIFMVLLNDEQNLKHYSQIAETLTCLALLTSTCQGEKMSRDFNLLNTVNKFLHCEDPDIHTNAAHVIMFCTVITKQKIEAAAIPFLPKRLVALCKNSLNRSAQIYAIQALINICEHPEIRKIVRENYNKEIGDIQVAGNKDIQKFKDQLLTTVGWVESSST